MAKTMTAAAAVIIAAADEDSALQKRGMMAEAKEAKTTLRPSTCGKAASTSGIITKMLQAAGDDGVELARQLTKAVFSCSVIPSDWEESFSLNLYKDSGEALDHGNYRGLKLRDHVMKLLEWVLDSYINEMVNIDKIQFDFVSGKGTTDAIFIISQLKKYMAANKWLYFAFIVLEKAFDHVPRKVLWWALRSCCEFGILIRPYIIHPW